MILEGKFIEIGNLQRVGSNNFNLQKAVLQTEGNYPQFIELQFNQDNTDFLQTVVLHDRVRVSVNLKGRKWVNPEGITKYFNTVEGWKIEKA